MSIRSISGTFDFFHKKKDKKTQQHLSTINEDENNSDDDDDQENGNVARNGQTHSMSRYEKRAFLPTGRRFNDITRIRNKANKYSESFSIIGLTRVFTGNPVERIFWCLILAVAIFLGFYMSWELTVKYVKKDVRTETSTVITDKNYFPTVTICVDSPRKKMYCAKNIIKNPGTSTEMEKPCEEYKKPNNTKPFQPFENEKHMIVGPFKVSCQLRGTCDDFEHLHPKFFTIDSHFHGCLVWNYNGDFYNDENRIDFEIEIIQKDFNQDEDPVRIYVDDRNVYLPLQENYLTTTVWQHYQLSFKKVVKERLPAPYTSRCVENSSGNIFPGAYSLISCMESKRCIDTFKRCGDTYDYCRPFIPKDIQNMYYQKHKSILSIHECLHPAFYEGGDVTTCDLPCHEVVYDIYGSGYHFKQDPTKTNRKFRLSMRYEDSYVYYKEEEGVLYSWGDLLGGVGGNIGLFCGFSMLSLVEIVSFILLILYAKGAVKRLKRIEEIKGKQRQNKDEENRMEDVTKHKNTLV